jgi:hypothetical protein
MFGSLTSPKRERVNTLRLIHSLALRACILNGLSEHGAVQPGTAEFSLFHSEDVMSWAEINCSESRDS